MLFESATYPEKREYLDAIKSVISALLSAKQNIDVRNNNKTTLCNPLTVLKLASEKIF